MYLDDPEVLSKREKEWMEIENLVMLYQSAILTGDTQQIQQTTEQLIARFTPLFTKYIRVIKYCEINFYNKETRTFVFSFVEKSLRTNYIKNKPKIINSFKFVVRTYGILSEEEILSDMYEIFLKLAKRYKQVGRHFCAYVYHVFCFEMNRHIKKYVEDPLNIPYKLSSFTDAKSTACIYEEPLVNETTFSTDWINGSACDNIFEGLEAIERKIIIAYYYEDMNDRQIAEMLCIHINTVNQRRKRAVKKIQSALPNGQELSIRRCRKVMKHTKTH